MKYWPDLVPTHIMMSGSLHCTVTDQLDGEELTEDDQQFG